MLQHNRCVYKNSNAGFLAAVIVGPIVVFIIIFIIIYCTCIKKRRNGAIINPLNNDSDEIIENNNIIPDSIGEGNGETIFEEDYNNQYKYSGYDTNIGN